MKRFFKLSWKGIPIGIIASVLICTAALAAILIPAVTQTITQEIEEHPVEYVYDYGTITAATDISLDNVVEGESGTEYFTDAVTVEVGPDGVDKYLHIELSGALELYTGWYDVTLTSEPGDNPMGSLSIRAGIGDPGSYQLTVAGTYIFTEKIQYQASGTAGGQTAVVIANITLQDTP